MENKKFDLLENIKLTNEDKEYFKYADMVNEIIIQLITRRLSLNMSQRDLAKITGIKQPMIARIEKFDSIPRLDTIVKMAYALGLSITFKNMNDNSNNMSIGIVPYNLDNGFDNQNSEMILSENTTNYNKKKRK